MKRKYIFAIGQSVQTKFELDYRRTGGPLIPKGTTAKVLKRCRDGSMWVEFEGGFGRRNEGAGGFELSLSPYQLAVKEIAEGIQYAMTNDGHDKESAISQTLEGLEDDLRDYLAANKV
jgi:hypothetical protein